MPRVARLQKEVVYCRILLLCSKTILISDNVEPGRWEDMLPDSCATARHLGLAHVGHGRVRSFLILYQYFSATNQSNKKNWLF